MDDEGLLLVRVGQGDERAFEAFLNRFWKPVFSLAYRFTGSAQESEDLCQEIFMKVYDNAKSFRGEGKTFTWVYRIATNTCLNWKRKEKNRLLSFAPERREQPSQASTSAEALANMEIKEAFASLSNPDRLLLLLSKFYGFSYEEMGDILSISSEKVKSRLHEAKTRLSAKLEPLDKGGGQA